MKRLIARIALLCIVYVGVARLGLLFVTPPDLISPVWPLTGLVFVTFLRGGLRLWPGVFLGELLLGMWLGIPFHIVLSAATVTVIEIVLTVLLLRPFVGPTLELDSLREVLFFILLTVAVSIPIGAGAAAVVFTLLTAGGWEYARNVWLAWYIGDVIGILAVAPTLLALQQLPFLRLTWLRIGEAIALYGLLILVTWFVMQGSQDYAYVLIVLIIWAGLRVGPRGTAVAIAIICVITVGLTALGDGPFVIAVPTTNLIFLQTFLAVLTMTGLIVSALVAERSRRLRDTQLMADIAGIMIRPEAEPAVLQAAAERLARWADGCCIDVLELDGRLQPIAAAATDPELNERVAALCAAGDSDSPPAADLRVRALQDRQPILLTVHEPRFIERIAHSAKHRQLWSAINPRVVMILPLISYESPLGTITLFSCDRVRVYQHTDLQAAQDAADRIAQGITATRLTVEIGRLQRLEALGRLASGIAHDFGNLLSIIVGRGELALDSLAANDPAAREIGAALLAARQAGQLVRELRVIGQGAPASLQDVLLNDLVMRMQALLPALAGKAVELVYDLDPTVGMCRIDPAQVERVIINLVTNARDAMPAGGRITLSTGSRTVEASTPELSQLAPGPYVWLSIRDTGSGIAPPILAHIFEPYFTTKAPDKGSGLGLAVSYGIIKQFGGALTVQSEPGRGTQFVIYLPELAVELEQGG